MAQAVAAQAFARTAALVPDEATALMREARAAYRVIPGRLLTSVAGRAVDPALLVPVAAGAERAAPGRDLAAVVCDDGRGRRLPPRSQHGMQRAAAATLPSFDTGYWTYYSLPREPSPLDYQQYVVQLLKKLAPAVGAREVHGASRLDLAILLASWLQLCPLGSDWPILAPPSRLARLDETALRVCCTLPRACRL